MLLVPPSQKGPFIDLSLLNSFYRRASKFFNRLLSIRSKYRLCVLALHEWTVPKPLRWAV